MNSQSQRSRLNQPTSPAWVQLFCCRIPLSNSASFLWTSSMRSLHPKWQLDRGNLFVKLDRSKSSDCRQIAVIPNKSQEKYWYSYVYFIMYDSYMYISYIFIMNLIYLLYDSIYRSFILKSRGKIAKLLDLPRSPGHQRIPVTSLVALEIWDPPKKSKVSKRNMGPSNRKNEFAWGNRTLKQHLKIPARY